jgi:localization factor PodJL
VIKDLKPTAILWAVASTFVAPSASLAGFAEGMLAYSRGDMKAAIREFLPAAQAEDSRAQFLLAQIYERTDRTPKGQSDAVMWYRRAAVNGVVAAMRRLGDIYGEGRGGHNDPVQAYAWYDLASSRLSPHRDQLSRLRDDLATKMPTSALDHARHVAFYWRANTSKIGTMIPAPRPPPDPKDTVDAIESLKTADKESGPAAPARVRRVQTALASRGYDVGPIDGIMGSRTRAAIRAFQSDQGLEADGRLSAGLIEKLEGDAEGG